MERKQLSFQELLEDGLKEAKDLHHLAVQIGVEKDENWVSFYARFLVQKLKPVLTGLQHLECPVVQGNTGVGFSVEGMALPPFYTRKTQEEVGSEITSRFHVGE